jgi:hypothetical protein
VRKLAFLLSLFALPLFAQTAHEDLKSLQDNSFLLEEAYNQDPGVAQHIGVFTRGDHDAWELTFTEEWPLAGQRHQISYDIPLVHDGDTNFGDISINYRYQLVGDGDSDLAIAPRISAIVPSSDESSDAGLSIGVPFSYVFAPRAASHTNVEVTFQDGTEFSIGQSLVYAVSSRMNVHLEGTYSRDDDDHAETVVSPGVRWSFKRPSGLQIVPGVAALFGHEDALLLYLSFEHPFRR